MSIKTLQLPDLDEIQRKKFKNGVEGSIREHIRNVAYFYLTHTLKSPEEVDGKMACNLDIDLIIDKELLDYKDYLLKKFYKNNFRNVMYVARNYNFGKERKEIEYSDIYKKLISKK